MNGTVGAALGTAAGVAALGVAGVGYASVVERNWFALRRFTVPVLAPGSRPLRILQVSDLHLVPRQRRRIEWVRGAGRPAAGPRRQLRRQPGCPRRRAGGAARDGAAVRLPRSLRHGVERLLRAGAEEPGPLPHPPPRRGTGPAASSCRSRTCAPGCATAAGSTSTTCGPRCRGGRRGRARRHRRRPHPHRQVCRRWPALRSDAAAVTIGVTHAPYQRVLDPMVGRRSPTADRRPHPRRPARPAVLRRAGDQLRPPDRPRQGRLAVVAGCGVGALVRRSVGRRLAARVGRAGHVALRAGAVRLPARGHPAHPGAHTDAVGRMAPRGTPRLLGATRGPRNGSPVVADPQQSVARAPRRATARPRSGGAAYRLGGPGRVGYPSLSLLPSNWRGWRLPRGVAQLGSALRSGRRGRRFKSCHPDQHNRRSKALCHSRDEGLCRAAVTN